MGDWADFEEHCRDRELHIDNSDLGCEWHEDEAGNWTTACGHMFMFFTDGPGENKMRFCPYCSKPLTATAYVELKESI